MLNSKRGLPLRPPACTKDPRLSSQSLPTKCAKGQTYDSCSAACPHMFDSIIGLCRAWTACLHLSAKASPLHFVRGYHCARPGIFAHMRRKPGIGDLTSLPVGWSTTPPGRVMVVLLMMRPSMPSFMDTAAMSDLSASVRSGAILTSRGGGPLRPHCI